MVKSEWEQGLDNSIELALNFPILIAVPWICKNVSVFLGNYSQVFPPKINK